MNKKQIVLIGLIIVVALPFVYGEEDSLIPKWIKPIASFWVEGSITDEKFIEVLKFLIDHEVIVIQGYGKIDIQEEEIIPMVFSLSIDKETYTINEIVQVSGTLPDNDVESISFLLKSPNNMIVTIFSITTDTSGEYLKSLQLHEKLMTENGDYILEAHYKNEKIETIIRYNVN